MILFQWRTGCRPQEVCELRFDRIERDRPVWVYRPVTHKTVHHGHERMILIGPKAQRILRNFWAPSADSSYVFNPQLAEAARRTERHKQRVTALSYGNRPGSNRKR